MSCRECHLNNGDEGARPTLSCCFPLSFSDEILFHCSIHLHHMACGYQFGILKLEKLRRSCDVAWDMVCQPLNSGGLECVTYKEYKCALLTRWVGRITRHEDLSIKMLKDSYVTSLDWERHVPPVRGASAFW